MATYKSIRYLVPDEVVEHTDSINVLADVDTSTVAPEVGQTLKWTGNSKWKPRDMDSTNQAPTISSPGVATIAESTVTGRAVATILFSDPENDPLTFSITAGNTGNAFTISNTGVITTATALDYETTTSYTLTIDASDLAGNGDTTTQTVNVTNNADPVVSNTSTVTLAENSTIGTSISTISATDAEGTTITYSITAGNIADVFTINSSTGEITTNRILDYEFTTSYNLTISATDASGEIGTVTQTVNVTDVTETNPGPTQKAIFGFGYGIVGSGNYTVSMTNLVSSTGVVATDTTGVGTARNGLAAAGFGGDKAIFGFGIVDEGYTTPTTNITNLVSNTGVVATDTSGVGTDRSQLAAAGFGGDKAIFGFGYISSGYGAFGNATNKVSNTGVVVADTTGVGTARQNLAAAGFGGDKAIFGFGGAADRTNITNLVSNLGVVATDTTGVGTIRTLLSAAGYGGNKAIFGFGHVGSSPYRINITNLVSNTGVVASDTTGVGKARYGLAAAGYGGDKAIFGFGYDSNQTTTPDRYTNVTNLVSNTGVVSSDSTGVGTIRQKLAAAGYSSTA